MKPMKSRQIYRILIGCLFLTTFLMSGSIYACSCLYIYGFDDSSLVFEGEVIDKTTWAWIESEKHGALSEMIRYRFRVQKLVKGNVGSEVIIDTPVHNCGYFFDVGNTYKVYARSFLEYGIAWETDICSLTRGLVPYQKDIDLK